jgi:hypothetical protein
MNGENIAATRGRVLSTSDGKVVFQPRNSSYELYLQIAVEYSGPIDSPISAVIRAKARKVYTVPSGGNFITPIQGPPRIVQARVIQADERSLIVHATANFVIELPTVDSAIDLDEGPIAPNRMVNVVLFPGATFELAPQAAAASRPL